MNSPPGPDLLRVAMIAQARSRGLTWAQIGSVLSGGVSADPRLAKRDAKRLARKASRQAVLALREPDDTLHSPAS